MGPHMLAGEPYIVLITLYDDWDEIISNSDLIAAACPLLTLARSFLSLSLSLSLSLPQPSLDLARSLVSRAKNILTPTSTPTPHKHTLRSSSCPLYFRPPVCVCMRACVHGHTSTRYTHGTHTVHTRYTHTVAAEQQSRVTTPYKP